MIDYADYIARFEKLQGRHGLQEQFMMIDHDPSVGVDRSRAMRGRYVARGTKIVARRCVRVPQSTSDKAVLATIVSVVFISASLMTMAPHGTIGFHGG